MFSVRLVQFNDYGKCNPFRFVYLFFVNCFFIQNLPKYYELTANIRSNRRIEDREFNHKLPDINSQREKKRQKIL